MSELGSHPSPQGHALLWRTEKQLWCGPFFRPDLLDRTLEELAKRYPLTVEAYSLNFPKTPEALLELQSQFLSAHRKWARKYLGLEIDSDRIPLEKLISKILRDGSDQ